jgi:hypothetical protein
MLFNGPGPVPPLPPGYELPSPIYTFAALFLSVLLFAECAVYLLPGPWRFSVFRAVFDRVWPFDILDKTLDKWIRLRALQVIQRR